MTARPLAAGMLRAIAGYAARFGANPPRSLAPLLQRGAEADVLMGAKALDAEQAQRGVRTVDTRALPGTIGAPT